MSSRLLLAAAIPCLVLLAGADVTHDSLRKGNAAYARGEYLEAIEHYAAAEGDALDPGQVAYNKAAAHYQLAQTSKAQENYQLANDHYRRSLEDAVGVRRFKAMYGLSNTLAQQAHRQTGRDAVPLWKAAIQGYGECQVAYELLSESEQAENRELLEVAERHAKDFKERLRILEEELAKEPPAAEPKERPEEPKKDHKPPPGKPDNKKPQPIKSDPTQKDPQPIKVDKPIETPETQVGKGDLRPLEAAKEVMALDADLAEAYLEQRLREIRLHLANRPVSDRVKGKQPRDY